MKYIHILSNSTMFDKQELPNVEMNLVILNILRQNPNFIIVKKNSYYTHSLNSELNLRRVKPNPKFSASY